VTEEAPAKKEIAAIKGTKDILPAEASEWQRVESLAKATFELYGYREIRTPIFEATELFEKGTGETTDIVTKEMYTFTDKGGRSVTLRPEYTPSVARAILEHRLYLQPKPLRFYYVGPMFRYDKPQKGRYRQFHQVDIEVFGEKDPAIDAEIIEMADFFLKKLGVRDTETLVNSVGCQVCRPGYSRELRHKAEQVKEKLCPDCQRKVTANPLRIFDCKVEGCRELALSFPKILNFLCRQCEEHFREFCLYLDLYGIRYRVEPNLVRGIDYYTKTTFEIISSKLGSQNSILGGGRYDNLMKNFGGPDICAIGFAMGVERLLTVVEPKREGRRFVYLVYMGAEGKKAAMALARACRQSGVECLLEYKEKSLKNSLSRASKLGATWTLIAGQEEVSRGRFLLKDMAGGEQKEGSGEELLKIMTNLKT
jgi:histidyl-tRNA synthetase